MRISASALLLLLAPGALADTIYLVDGSIIDDVRIEEDSLTKVVYKGKKDGDVEAEKVRRITHDRFPPLVDQAETAVQDDQIATAIQDLEGYIAGIIGKPQKRFPWAPAYAMWRVIELQRLLGNHAAVVSGVDRLMENAPESRYVPMALLEKAQALYDGGKAAKALETVESLGQLVSAKGLSKRWEMEQELQTILFNDQLQPTERRDRLEEIVATAVEFPLVRNRAYVAIGESYLERKKYEDAQKIFRGVVDDPKASARTLAAAYTGLGDCLFARGAGGKDAGVLREAALAYMRVVVSYPEEVRYVPKAMFYAGRSFQMMEGDEEAKTRNAERASKLYRAVMRDYDGTKWANEARSFR